MNFYKIDRNAGRFETLFNFINNVPRGTITGVDD